MQFPSLLRSFVVAGAVAGVPASLAAQSCMGFALGPNQHSATFVVAGMPSPYDPGPGGALAGVLKNNASYAFQLSTHYVDMGGPDWEMMNRWQVTVGRPVLQTRTLASGATAGPCALVELGGSSFMGNSGTNAGFGFGYSMNGPKYALFAAPFLGIASAGDASDSYIKLVFGGGTRLGVLQLGSDVTVPVAPSGGDATWNFRIGFGWGKATAIPVRPSRNSPTTGTTMAGGAAATTTTSSAAPSAGTKPYALEDIEAMVKNGVATARILELSKQSCLSFRMSDDADTRLRRVGADAALLSGLRQSCYSAS